LKKRRVRIWSPLRDHVLHIIINQGKEHFHWGETNLLTSKLISKKKVGEGHLQRQAQADFASPNRERGARAGQLQGPKQVFPEIGVQLLSLKHV